jgi:hypothetical protein
MRFGTILYCPVENASAQTSAPRRLASDGLGHLVRGALGLALLLALPGNAFGQAPTQGTDPTYSSPGFGSTSSEGVGSPFGRPDPVYEERRQQALRAEKQRLLNSYTELLLKLTHELDDEISRTNPDTLTAAELKKIAEIEKLAHKVKSTMSELDRRSPPSQTPPLIVVPQHP